MKGVTRIKIDVQAAYDLIKTRCSSQHLEHYYSILIYYSYQISNKVAALVEQHYSEVLSDSSA
jgi:predicted Zn-dependent protease